MRGTTNTEATQIANLGGVVDVIQVEKTGTTNGYGDISFLGYSKYQMASGKVNNNTLDCKCQMYKFTNNEWYAHIENRNGEKEVNKDFTITATFLIDKTKL